MFFGLGFALDVFSSLGFMFLGLGFASDVS